MAKILPESSDSQDSTYITFFLYVAFVLKVFFLIKMCVLPVSMEIYHMGTWSSQWSKDGFRIPELGIIDSRVPEINNYYLSPPVCDTRKSCSNEISLLLIYDQHLIIKCFHLSFCNCFNIEWLLVKSYWRYSLMWAGLGFWKLNTDSFIVTSVRPCELFLSVLWCFFFFLTDFGMGDKVLVCTSGCPVCWHSTPRQRFLPLTSDCTLKGVSQYT